MNYYELLNIDRDADNQAIKRAYFTAVKSHSPDSDPEGFKAVRTAYVTLSDSKKRAEYDEYFAAPDDIQNALLAARQLISENKYKTAVEYLTGLCERKPDSAEAKRLLAEALWITKKSVTAEKLCGELLKKEPSDYETLLLRAKIAESRGHTGKAGEYLNNAVTVAPLNPKAWIKYMRHAIQFDISRISGIFERAMDKSPDMFIGDYYLYLVGAVELSVSSAKSLFRAENPLQYFDRFAEFFVKDEKPSKTVYLTVLRLASNIVGKDELVPFVEKILPALENSRYRRDEDEKSLKDIRTIITVHKLHADARIHEILVGLTEFLLWDDGERNDRLALECYVVSQLPGIRSSIKVLRNDYPDCFELNQAFYLEALNERKIDFLTEKYLAIYKRIKPLIDGNPDDEPDDEDFYDDYADTEVIKPFMRETPKIGRNDPCPCGSGKKYKKCCGRN